MRTDRVEEVTVVADNQHGVFEVRQIVFKPHDGFKVEVVGRLVQQQVIRLSEEGACQQDTYFLLTAHVLHQRVVEFFSSSDTRIPSASLKSGFAYRAFFSLITSQRVVCPINTVSITVYSSNAKWS